MSQAFTSRRNLLAVAPAALLIAGTVQAQTGAVTPNLQLQTETHRIDRDTTITGDVALDPGARIEVAAGATLTLAGHFAALIAYVFTGPGAVDLDTGAQERMEVEVR